MRWVSLPALRFRFHVEHRWHWRPHGVEVDDVRHLPCECPVYTRRRLRRLRVLYLLLDVLRLWLTGVSAAKRAETGLGALSGAESSFPRDAESFSGEGDAEGAKILVEDRQNGVHERQRRSTVRSPLPALRAGPMPPAESTRGVADPCVVCWGKVE